MFDLLMDKLLFLVQGVQKKIPITHQAITHPKVALRTKVG